MDTRTGEPSPRAPRSQHRCGASGHFPAAGHPHGGRSASNAAASWKRCWSKVADTYDEQVETTIERATALLEPALILLMVGIVLVIILATLVPLLQITSSLR